VPLTLAQLPINCEFGVFEIGMNHAGEITPLTGLVAPHVAIVTTIAPAHLQFFGTLDKIAEAKSEIFLGVEKGGAAVLPRDNSQFPLLKGRAVDAGIRRIISFGEAGDADIRLVDYAHKGDAGRIKATVFGEKIDYELGALGRHQAMNSLAVLAALKALNEPLAPALGALSRFSAAEGRGARRKVRLATGGEILLIDESYNANPASMAAALALLGAARPHGKGRRIAVLGEMLELGEGAPALHAGLAEPLVAAKVDKLYAAGGLMRHLWDAAPAAMRAERAGAASELIGALIADLGDGDVVMIKGSNASKVSDIVRALENQGAGAAAKTASA
jgi:UDP-N-acetylmuramoyl-tripeptide--D-alanyl-D-alanine ligase